jgi:hypothetical protein
MRSFIKIGVFVIVGVVTVRWLVAGMTLICLSLVL